MIRQQRRTHLLVWLGLPLVLLAILYFAGDQAEEPIGTAPYAEASEVLP